MDDLILMGIVKKILIFSSIVGLLSGVDLIFGAKVTTSLKKVLDKAMVNLDKTMFTVKARIALGALFLITSVLMLSIVISTH